MKKGAFFAQAKALFSFLWGYRNHTTERGDALRPGSGWAARMPSSVQGIGESLPTLPEYAHR